MSQKRIAVVEDERDMAELIAMRLQRDGYAVEKIHDGLEAAEQLRAKPPDLILLDIMLPGMSGIDLVTELRNDPRTAEIPVIMLTAKSEDSDIIVGLKLGADDYVTKPFSMSVLLARIDSLLRRSHAPRSSMKGILTAGPVRIDQQRHRVEVDGKPAGLTLTEFRLLVALVAARGRVLTRSRLIDQAIGMDAIVTDRTIDVHMTALRRKLGEARKLIRTVRGLGYRLVTETDETT